MYADLVATYSLFSKAGLYTTINTPTCDRVLTNQRLETVQGIYEFLLFSLLMDDAQAYIRMDCKGGNSV